LPAPSSKLHSDSASASINAVFDEFFDYGRWPLDHLTGSDLAGDLICK
jgi:hypothetical protein